MREKKNETKNKRVCFMWKGKKEQNYQPVGRVILTYLPLSNTKHVLVFYYHVFCVHELLTTAFKTHNMLLQLSTTHSSPSS